MAEIFSSRISAVEGDDEFIGSCGKYYAKLGRIRQDRRKKLQMLLTTNFDSQLGEQKNGLDSSSTEF